MSFAFFWLLLVLMIFGLPIAFALMIAPGISLFMDGQESMFPMLVMRMYNGMDSFPLMAIPYFILAGEVMNRGGITERLVSFSHALIGHLRGGLAHVNILTSILFAVRQVADFGIAEMMETMAFEFADMLKETLVIGAQIVVANVQTSTYGEL